MINSVRLDQINYESYSAALYIRDSAPQDIPHQLADKYFYVDVLDEADDEVIPNAQEVNPSSGANRVVVADIEELGYAIHSLNRYFNHRVDPVKVLIQQAHEAQHGITNTLLGIRGYKYAVSMFRNNNQFSWQASTCGGTKANGTTKLELAASIAAPICPSDGDRYIIESMGYSGIQDVGERIVRKNLEAGTTLIPVPLSYLRNKQ